MIEEGFFHMRVARRFSIYQQNKSLVDTLANERQNKHIYVGSLALDDLKPVADTSSFEARP